MKEYVPLVPYNPEEEAQFGFRSLDGYLSGAVDPRGPAFVRLSGPGIHNPRITQQHEGVHQRLTYLSTIGNVQQLLGHATRIEKSHSLTCVIKDLYLKSLCCTRWLHEGCATYVALKRAKVYSLGDVREARRGHPAFCIDALRPYEDILDPLPVSEDSKSILAETLLRFALSPQIYDIFMEPSQLPSVDPCIFASVNDRFFALLRLFADERCGREVADSYNAFIKQTWRDIHGFEYGTNAKRRWERVLPDNLTRSNLAEITWLYDAVTQRAPLVDIVRPERIPDIHSLVKRWVAYFEDLGIAAEPLLAFNTVTSQPEVAATVTVKPPGLSNLQIGQAPPSDILAREFRRAGAATFAQVYVHGDAQPRVLDASTGTQVRKDDAYIRFSRARLVGDCLHWDLQPLYKIVPAQEALQYLQSVDSHTMTICISEKDVSHFLVGESRHSKFCNPIAVLVNPTRLQDLKEMTARWLKSIEACCTSTIAGTGNDFVLWVCPSQRVHLLAPVTMSVGSQYAEWFQKNVDGGTRLWKADLAVETVETLPAAIAVQGIAFYGF